VSAWPQGAHIVVRQLFRGRVWNATPAIVVKDEPDEIAVWLPPNVSGKIADGQLFGDWTLVDVTWRDRPHGILRVSVPGEAHATLFLWQRDWRIDGWYVNLERPVRRTAVGFDVEDLLLDVWIGTDGSVRWLDRDEFDDARKRGVLTRRDADGVLREAEQAIERAVARQPPYDGEWERWRPPLDWQRPVLPTGWEIAPGDAA
jgi:hypothetical protein